MLDFGRWIVEVAVNGVKSGSFDRAWAAMQLGNHYSRDRITAEDIARFDTAIDEYEAEISNELIEISSIFGAIVATIGGVIGWIWGDFTPLLAALIVCMVLDYISGVACAIVRKDVSSEVGFKGIVKKILILMLVGVAHVLDAYVLNSTPVLQSAVTMFFIANEGISLVENAAGLGIPIPKKMLEVLKQLKLKGDSTEKDESEDE